MSKTATAGMGPDVDTGPTINDLLHRAASFPQAGLRLVDRREVAERKTWAELRQRALAVAGGLRARGVGAGDRVAIVFPTGWEFIDAFFGTLVAGAVPVPLYPPVRLGRLAEYQRRTAAMVTAAGAVLVLAERRVKRILGPTVRAASPGLGCHTLSELPTAAAEPAEVGPNDLALVQFSSGTTLEPKPVAISHRAATTQIVLLNRLWPDRPGRPASGVSWLPLYHDMGLIGCLLAALGRPGPLTLLRPEDFLARPALWLRAISRYRATLSAAPNFAYGLCAKKIRDEEMAGVDLSCWSMAACGAEPVAPGVMRAFAERFRPWGLAPEVLTPVYGLAEATLAVTFSDLERPFTSLQLDRDDLAAGRVREAPGGVEIVSVGSPLPGFELRIADPGGEPLPAGHTGQVLVRGPSLMTGYLRQPEATARAWVGEWLATGDLGFVHRDELYLVGRLKDLLILRGRNHAPEEVERAVDAVEGVRTGCTVAVSYLPEEAEGEVLVVLVEVRRDTPRAAFAAIAEGAARAVLAVTDLAPDRIEILPPGTLPRTSSGKMRRGEALRRYLAGELGPAPDLTRGRLVTAVGRSALDYARWRWERVRT